MAEPYRPTTQILPPSMSGLPRQYISTRSVPAEYTAPARGATLGNTWGPAYAAHFVLDATITPNAGQLIETVIHCSPAAWVVLYGSERDAGLNASVGYTQQVVTAAAAGSGTGDPLTEYTPINEALSLRRTRTLPSAALAAYMDVCPCRVDLPDLPRELLSVNVLWNQSYSLGRQDYMFYYATASDSGSINKSASDAASSEASISPEIQLKFRDVASSGYYGNKYTFFLPKPVTTAAILGKVGAQRWPVFKPESVTITASGQSISVRANVKISLEGSWDSSGVKTYGWDRNVSDRFAVNLSHNSIQIPACIHGAIAFTNAAPRIQLVAATAYMNMTSSILGSNQATCTKAGNAAGWVSPTNLSGTPGRKSIPTSGRYLIDSSITDYDYGYARITAIVFDASILA